MNHRARNLFALCASVAFILTSSLPARDLLDSYEWKPMKIGGGGWVVGLDISPTEKGLMYARTDVSGAYRWQPESGTWKQVVTEASMPKQYVDYGKYGGVVSLVSAPKDPDIAYMAFRGQIFRSTDRGEQWLPTTFETKNVSMDANDDGRQEGERLAVDPTNSDLVYFAPTQGPLWRAEDAGQVWTEVGGIPAGKAPHGVNSVVFDPKGGTVKMADGREKSKVIYVTVDLGGIHRSTDGGATWKNIGTDGPGDAARSRNAELGPDGTYFLACDNSDGAVGSVWKYREDKGWTNITPPAPNGGSQPYWDVAIDPTNDQRLVAMEHGGKGFVSNDQGATWTYHLFRLNSKDIAWLNKQEQNYYLSVGEFKFDPFNPGRLWFAEGLGVWWVEDLAPQVLEWQEASRGIEESCVNEVIAPPDGQPVAAVWDNSAFYFSDPDTYTAQRAKPNFMAGWALDWCPADPKFIAAIFQNNLNFGEKPKVSGFSTDGGQTWQCFDAIETKSLPADLEYGAIAISANTPDNIVWCPAFGKLPYYSTDRGATWKQSACGDLKQTGITTIYKGQKPLCADRVLPGTFYLYTATDGFYRSTDGGATFAKVSDLPNDRASAKLKSTPGQAGHLWFAEGAGGALWHSKNGGETWETMPGVVNCVTVGLGKPEKPDGYPTVFAAGVKDGLFGIYRSTNEGADWEQVSGYPMGMFEWISSLEGDKDVFGKVYVGLSQAGLVYGQPKK